MAEQDLWQHGRPPTDNELRRYLTHDLGIPQDTADAIASVYSDDPGGINDSGSQWTRESLNEWLSGQLNAHANQMEGGGGQVQAAAAQVRAERDEDAARQESGQDAAAAATQQVINAGSNVYAQSRIRYVRDYQPEWNPDAISQSLASGVLTDDRGRPVIDPDTGQAIPADWTVIFDQVRDQAFNMGNLGFTFGEQRERQIAQGRNKRQIEAMDEPPRQLQAHMGMSAIEGRAAAGQSRGSGGRVVKAYSTPRGFKRFITPSQALKLLAGMNDDSLIQLQQQMFDAGLYDMVAQQGESPLPSWGTADPVTRRAFMRLFVEASGRGNKSISAVLSDLALDYGSRTDAGGSGGSGGGGGGGGAPQMLLEIPDFAPETMSKETLGSMVDDIAQDLLGQYVDPDTKARLVQQMQDKHVGLQRTQYDRSVADIRQGGQAQFAMESAQAQPGGTDLDAFMAAISSTESGGSYTISNSVGPGHYGKYQISNANWRPWATAAGLGPNAPKTPENQEIVARHRMGVYYNQFGNWRDVAIAWFAGPGAVGRPGAEGRSDGNMTVRAYADRAVQRMAQYGGGGATAAGGITEVGGEHQPVVETFDPNAELEAMLKAHDPAGWQSHEFGERAVEWISLLGGLV